MSALSEITALVQQAGLTMFVGYPATGAVLPYTVQRPLIVSSQDLALAGNAYDYDYQTALYAAAESVEASFNLALLLMATLQGARVGGTTLSTSIGYSGAQVEGHYETQLTVQLNQGGI